MSSKYDAVGLLIVSVGVLCPRLYRGVESDQRTGPGRSEGDIINDCGHPSVNVLNSLDGDAGLLRIGLAATPAAAETRAATDCVHLPPGISQRMVL